MASEDRAASVDGAGSSTIVIFQAAGFRPEMSRCRKALLSNGIPLAYALMR